MSASAKQESFRLGFLTAIEVAERGYVGGLLVTNHLGRPLEFQCTTPVRPNRAQQILYGPTLGPYVLADLIGRTLIEKVAVKPHLLLVEDRGLLDLRQHVDLPVAVPVASDEMTRDPTVTLGQQSLLFHCEFGSDSHSVGRGTALVPKDADLREPFDRIRDALVETLSIGQAAA
jgi:hypothetical protein